MVASGDVIHLVTASNLWVTGGDLLHRSGRGQQVLLTEAEAPSQLPRGGRGPVPFLVVGAADKALLLRADAEYDKCVALLIGTTVGARAELYTFGEHSVDGQCRQGPNCPVCESEWEEWVHASEFDARVKLLVD